MTKTVEFVSEIKDLSNDKGYQFTFHCDKCRKGYTSTYKAATLAPRLASWTPLAEYFKILGRSLERAGRLPKECSAP